MPEKKYSLFGLAVLLLAFACVTFILAFNNLALRSAGLLAILASVSLVRASNVHRRPGLEMANRPGMSIGTVKRLGCGDWTIGILSVLAAGASYLYLRNDALNGYHQVFPVYVFAAVGVVCMVVWGYLAVKLLR
jgi:hypothetical protein